MRLYLILCLSVISLLADLHAQISQFNNKQSNRLRMGFVLKNEFQINPLINHHDYEREINNLIFGHGIFRKDIENRVFLALASVARRENGNRWRITLRGDITFHDRSPITSTDVKFTFELYKKFALQSPYLFKARLIDRVEIIDERSFIIILKRPQDDFQQTIGLMPILPKKIYRTWIEYNYISSLPDIKPVGSGYFLFRRMTPANMVQLGTNQYHYYGPSQLDGVEIFFYKSYEQLVDAFINEQIDILPVYDEQIFTKVRQFTKVVEQVMAKKKDFVLFYLNFNTKQAPFNDINTRRALSYSINRNQLAGKDFVKRSQIAANILTENSRYYPPKTTSYSYNPLNSLQILENAGYRRESKGKLVQNGRELRFELLFEEGSSFQESIVRLISINLAEIGINAIPQPVSARDLEEKIAIGEYQAALQSFVYNEEYPEEVIRRFYLQELNRPEGYKNYKTREMDRILNRLEGILPDQTALPNWHRLQVLINRDAPCIFLFRQDHAYYFIHVRLKQTHSQFEENYDFKSKLNPKHEWIIKIENPE